MRTNNVDKKRESMREETQFNFRIKQLPLCRTYPILAKFPTPAQRMISEQHKLAQKMLLDPGDQMILKQAVCHCGFYRKYLLPCKHVFYTDLIGANDEPSGTFLTDARWNYYLGGWDECGYDVYVTKAKVEIPYVPPEPTVSGTLNENLKANLESIKRFYLKYAEDKRRAEEGDKFLQMKALIEETVQKLAAIDLSDKDGTEQSKDKEHLTEQMPSESAPRTQSKKQPLSKKDSKKRQKDGTDNSGSKKKKVPKNKRSVKDQ